MIYKRKCNYCYKKYKGQGKYFCSKECSYSYFSGEKNHFWKGGITSDKQKWRRQWWKGYSIKNRKRINKNAALWYYNNIEKAKKLALESRRRIRYEVLEHYGNKCNCCGETILEFLAIDHVNNDGSEHRKKIGKNIYHWAKRNNYPNNLQILCHNCNMAKNLYGACPHKFLVLK